MKQKATMTKIEKIWTELEKDDSFHSGLLFTRYAASVIPDVFVALRSPGSARCISAQIKRENAPDIEKLNKLKDINVEVIDDIHNRDKCHLLILLSNQHHKDIFSVLCEDLINQVSMVGDQTALVHTLLNRLGKWQILFEKCSQPGLKPEMQRGLFGELYFLRRFLQNSPIKKYCIDSWQTQSNTVQDFNYGNWAVEVKTTHGNNHQKVQISSERQLDTSTVPNVFLYHLSIDVRKKNGETLNDLVEWVEEYLTNDVVELNSFKLKLFEIGYFAVHRAIYSDSSYKPRQIGIYKVEGAFPRIIENDLLGGVGDVKYSIIIANCLPFSLTETEVFKALCP